MPKRCTEVIGVKVTPDLAEVIRRRASEDDRTVSGYVRRVLQATFGDEAGREADLESDEERPR